MLISDLINNFRTFLILSWPCLSSILEKLDWDESPYFLENWLQANWELLVEQQILEDKQFMRPYGYDASPNCRFNSKGSVTTHQVICTLNGGGDGKKYIFLAFVTTSNGSNYKIEAPFDYVDVEEVNTGNRITLPIEKVDFSLETVI